MNPWAQAVRCAKSFMLWNSDQSIGRRPLPSLVVTSVTHQNVTGATLIVVEWVLLTYRLPTEPSRHRVAVWRELRRVGAVSLQQATWAVPKRPDFVAAVARAVDLIERADGESLVFDAVPQGDVMAARLETL